MRSRSALLTLLGSLLAAAAGATVITVTTLADDDVNDIDCSLREAIHAANGDAAYNGCAAGTGDDDRISVPLAGTIQLLSDLPEVTEALAISGLGPDQTIVDGGDLRRILLLSDDRPHLVERIALVDGSATFGGCIWQSSADGGLHLKDVRIESCVASFAGGGADVRGDLILERVAVLDNDAAGGNGGGMTAGNGIVWIRYTTLAGNEASGLLSSGGALHLTDTSLPRDWQILDSTISGNRAPLFAGGVYASATSATPTTLTIRRSTITANRADQDADGTGEGGGIACFTGISNNLLVTSRSSVIAANVDASPSGPHFPDLYLANAMVLWTSSGFNLIGANDSATTPFPAGSPNGNDDFAGTAASPIAPGLAPLAANGGPTPTHLPADDDPHPLIDQGSCPAVIVDQRGFGDGSSGLRIVDRANSDFGPGDGCDIGAAEIGAVDTGFPELFSDRFETGNFLYWSLRVP
jgi:CSLREA domain-containing protein